MGVEEPAFGEVLEAAAEVLGGFVGVFRDHGANQVVGDVGKYVSTLSQWWRRCGG